jgi:hypothetical protein
MNEGFQGQVLALIEKAVEQYGSAGKLAKASGVNAPNISRWRSGQQIPRVKDVAPIMDLMGVHVSAGEGARGKDVCWVDAKPVPAGEGLPMPLPEDYLAVPLVEEVGAGPGIVPQGELLSWFLVWRHQRAVMGKHDLIAVRIADRSTSMVPTLRPGDIVLVDRQDLDCSRPGRIMLAIDPEGSGMIKRVSVRQKPDRDWQITFYSDNAQENPPMVYSLREDYGGEWAKAIGGHVVWAWSDMDGR